ncbi:MAG: hypothetical protein M5R40_25525 [Anaerolineae bacterium]|nr:hypothetical protein [Anaerolineae bacterium]
MTLQDTRRAIRRLLDERSAADAPTAYYALHHPPARTALFIEEDARGRAVGFVARCQTGLDLFRPLVTMRCPAQDTSAEGAARLLDRALTPGRPYLLFVPESQYPLAGGSVQVESERVLRIYRLDRARFKPVINVMVMQRTGQDGAPRYEVRSGGVQAVAGGELAVARLRGDLRPHRARRAPARLGPERRRRLHRARASRRAHAALPG